MLYFRCNIKINRSLRHLPWDVFKKTRTKKIFYTKLTCCFYFLLKSLLLAMDNCFSSAEPLKTCTNKFWKRLIHAISPFRLYLIVAFHFQVYLYFNFSLILLKLFSCDFCFLSLVFCTNCQFCFDLVFLILIYKHLFMFLIGRQAP